MFRIYLLVSPESVEPAVKQTVAPSRKSGNILLIDDEPMVISLSENVLEIDTMANQALIRPSKEK